MEALGRLEEAERAYDAALAIDHRLMPSLNARANLLARRGDWMGALADLDMALTSQPGDAPLRLRRGELLLRQGDWLRGLADHEARLEIAGERYTPDLPRWQGEPLSGRLLIYPEQIDIESDAAMRDTLMLARGVEATVQCSARLAGWLDVPTIGSRRAVARLRRRRAAAQPALLAQLDPSGLAAAGGAAGQSRSPAPPIGWFSHREPPPGLTIERDPDRVANCKFVVGDDVWPTHLAAALGIPTVMLLPAGADWLWGPRTGLSPWYANLEVLRDADQLAARLQGP